MLKLRTFVDAGVLIEAARGIGAEHERAMRLLDDERREFVASNFLKLEVLPKPLYYKQATEAAFYEVFFNKMVIEFVSVEQLVNEAFAEAAARGLSAVDAMHIVAAHRLGASEFVTTEKPEKPIHRTQLIKVVTL